MTELKFEVLPGEDGKKIQQILRARGVSVRLMNRLKRTPGGLGLNCETVARTIDPARVGDVIILRIPEDPTPPEAIPCDLDIVYEDADVMVINKPPTLPMHPSHNHQGDTLANAVAAYMAKSGKSLSFRAAGRLDKGTSGLVVCCLHAFAASRLNGRVRKTYLALVHGAYRGGGVLDNAIYRPDPRRTLRACRDTAEPRAPGDERAVTHWESLAYRDGVSLLRIWLETGRTHQIRVHFAHQGTPLVGDDYYGAPARESPGHCLHCCAVEFLHPVTSELLRFNAPIPEPMKKLAEDLRLPPGEATCTTYFSSDL